MYEVETQERFALHPETLKQIREVFEGQTCTTCGDRAERLVGGKFYCPEHYFKNRKRTTSPRIYRCAVEIAE